MHPLEMRLRYIADPSYVPEIRRLSGGMLRPILSNHNMLPYITENIT